MLLRFASALSLPFAAAWLAAGACWADPIFIPILLHSVQAGQEIQKSDFTTKEYEVSGTARLNYVTEEDQLVGAVAMRSLPSGKPIPVAAIGAPPVVLKGKSTPVRFVQDGIEIVGILVPTKDGRAGETIPCRNPGSGLLVSALVNADGSLAVNSE